jgi:hypothetical protein
VTKKQAIVAVVGGCQRWMRCWSRASITTSEVTAFNVKHTGDNTDWEYDPTTVLICRLTARSAMRVDPDCKMPYQFNIDVVGNKGRSAIIACGQTLLLDRPGGASPRLVLPDSGM